ncbi:MAG TPA: hypothetical protein VJJ23_00075 [Candidatus Nanoarchaeia archaeon]|nr:hypothetical protein [Candidatus Nanoarchaeia archaeon]
MYRRTKEDRENILSNLETKLIELDAKKTEYKKLAMILNDNIKKRINQSTEGWEKVNDNLSYNKYVDIIVSNLEMIYILNWKNTMRTFSPGDKVKVVKTMGLETFNDVKNYYYGGNIREMPLGTVWEVYFVDNKIVTTGNNWKFHPGELELLNDPGKILKQYGPGKESVRLLVDDERRQIEGKFEFIDYTTIRKDMIKSGVSEMKRIGFNNDEITKFFNKLNCNIHELKEIMGDGKNV